MTTMARFLSRTAAAVAVLYLGLMPGESRASITFYDSFGKFNTALGSVNVDNILFNQNLLTSGTQVQGQTQGGLTLNFFSTFNSTGGTTGTLQNLLINSQNGQNGGQAKIGPGSGSTVIYGVNITTPSSPPPNTGSLQALSFNAQTVNQLETFKVTVVANEPGGGTMTFTSTYNATSGNQEVGIIATNGETIASVNIDATSGGGLIAINNLGEFRAAPGTPKAVPEPSTIALALSGFGAIGFAGLRNRRKPSANA